MSGDPRVNKFRIITYIFAVFGGFLGLIVGVILGVVAAIAAVGGHALATAFAVATTVTFALSAFFLAVPPFIDSLADRIDVTKLQSTSSEDSNDIEAVERDGFKRQESSMSEKASEDKDRDMEPEFN